MTEDPALLGQLAAAVAAVMAEVPNIEKTGENSFHRYKYASDADLLRRLQPAMARHGLMLALVSVDGTHTDVGGKQPWRYDCIATYRLVHSAGGWMDIQAVGCGADVLDKAPYKAMTGAIKYAMRQTFAVPTGDDPERDEPPRRAAPPREWTASQRDGFTRQTEELGLDLDSVDAWAQSLGRPPLATMGEDRRAKLLTYLGHPDGRRMYDEWAGRRDKEVPA